MSRIAAADEDGLFDRYVRVTDRGEPERFEYGHDVDDTWHWFEAVVVKLDDGCAVTLSDITDRKRFEVELREDERRMRLMVEGLRRRLSPTGQPLRAPIEPWLEGLADNVRTPVSRRSI